MTQTPKEIDKNDALVIVPAHNEEIRIPATLNALQEMSKKLDFDIVVINDGSNDRTSEIVVKAGYPCLSLPFHCGYGTTLQTGYKYAVSERYTYVIQIDADGQHDVRFLPMLLDELRNGKADVILGSRFLPHIDQQLQPLGDLYRGTPLRKIGIWIFRMVLRLWNLKITDPTTGYLGLNRKVVKFLTGDVFPYDYPDADVLLLLHRNRFKIKETPVYMYKNSSGGKLHRGVAPLWYIIKESLALFFAGLRRKERL